MRIKESRAIRASTIGWSMFMLAAIIGCSFTVFFQRPISSLLAAATSSLSVAPVVIYFTPSGSTDLSVGSSTTIDLDIDASIPINALGVTVQYPKDMLEIVGISKLRSFLNLWTEDTVIKESTGELHFSGGTTKKGGLTGTSTVLTITVRAKKTGSAVISVENFQVFAADGKGSSLPYSSRSLTFSIPQAIVLSASAPVTGTASRGPAQPYVLLGDLNGDGKVDLVDASLMLLHLLLPYDPHYDLDHNGSVGLSDLSIVFSHMGAH